MPPGFATPVSQPAPPVSQDGLRPLPRARISRAGLWLRLRVRWRAIRLDRMLAAGADPLESEELMLRADQLRRPRTHERLARSIARLSSLADDSAGHHVGPSRLPFRRDRVRENRHLLARIGEVLLSPGPNRLRGVAMTSELLEDGRGPLYANDTPADLARSLEQTLDALACPQRVVSS